ncbi:lycopene cyclase domain-containing protein [Lentzea jiangxiensis]|uniref:Lycopene cyclase domain-containing protein n=1 Tax=Lentzea jiangxiensis TaxID=641025 RepID=A0A1H0LDE3_9PSEU|nr:lycopene cyclase domain-containing protein [Lentzea jiangxiensis]SDO66155.1 lycopene cyclase domain-containing protein [Lentzea jiangxiensis]
MVEEYSLAATAAVVVVLLLEFCLLRTGLFKRPAYWVTMAVVLGFQVPVDGWLTKLDAPIVLYADWAITGVRVPWDIPVEDFLYGFAMVTAVLLLWERGRLAREQA